MPSLRDRQTSLQAAILADGADASPASMHDSPAVAVYRRAYRARLAGALRLNYPVLAELLGEQEFRRVADDYARAVPSSHYSIRGHGSDLWRSLDGARADLARMEWALGSAFDAPDAPPLAVGVLAAIPVNHWAGLPLGAHPSVAVLSMSWAVEAQWEAVRAGGVMAAAPPEEHAHALLVWRKNLQSHWRIASLQEARALRELDERGTLQRACDTLAEADAEAVGGWFSGWVQEGMLVAKAGAHA
ncbi:MAG: DNA-binding domain-containing protein [Usitatibacter sp.]